MNLKYNISAVIPVLGNWNYTEKCLTSLFSKSEFIDEIIVIDNSNDKDSTRAIIKNGYPCSIYAPGRNLGVGQSWDAGIKIAKNNIICVINNDVEIITEKWDTIIMTEWQKHEDAIVFCPWPASHETEDLAHMVDPLKGLNGSCFFVDRNSLQLTDNYKLLGHYIDPIYHLAYWEDCDLLVQVRKLGKESYVTSKVKTVHYSNKTAGPLLPSNKGMNNPYWSNLDKFNKKYGVNIWDYFKVFMSNVLDENSNERLI